MYSNGETRRLLDVLIKTGSVWFGVLLFQHATIMALLVLELSYPRHIFFYVGYGVPMLLALGLAWWRYSFYIATCLALGVCVENVSRALGYYPKYDRYVYLATLVSFVIMWMSISVGEKSRRCTPSKPR